MNGLKRLERLVEVLEGVAADAAKAGNFNMGYWGYKPTEEPSCGTVACACGWAAQDKILKEQGFHLGRFMSDYNGHRVATIRYKTYNNFDAAEKFFGITEFEAEKLFHPGNYSVSEQNDPAFVAKRIKKFICDKRKESRGPATKG